jgi:hypothetical protein
VDPIKVAAISTKEIVVSISSLPVAKNAKANEKIKPFPGVFSLSIFLESC